MSTVLVDKRNSSWSDSTRVDDDDLEYVSTTPQRAQVIAESYSYGAAFSAQVLVKCLGDYLMLHETALLPTEDILQYVSDNTLPPDTPNDAYACSTSPVQLGCIMCWFDDANVNDGDDGIEQSSDKVINTENIPVRSTTMCAVKAALVAFLTHNNSRVAIAVTDIEGQKQVAALIDTILLDGRRKIVCCDKAASMKGVLERGKRYELVYEYAGIAEYTSNLTIIHIDKARPNNYDTIVVLRPEDHNSGRTAGDNAMDEMYDLALYGKTSLVVVSDERTYAMRFFEKSS